MAEKVLTPWQVVRHQGARWALSRCWYALKRESRYLERKCPASAWEDHPFGSLLADTSLAEAQAYLDYRKQSAPKFFFHPSQRARFLSLLRSWDGEKWGPVFDAERILAGEIRYFGKDWVSSGFPPDWHQNTFSGKQVPKDLHWSRIGDFDNGDIKVIWEPNRFAFAYCLVRAYWRTGDERYPELFWRAVEDWRAQNPPQKGVNWKCGQEISFRVMAWCFGLYGFLDSPATTPKRAAMLGQMIAVSAGRIEANLGYALSQRNNHGISEGMGLWTIGLLFPEFREAPAWRDRGREILEQHSRELIYEDGSFAQNSVNYHRLMLHDYLWSLRLGELNGQFLSRELKSRVERAGLFLYELQDEESGRLPLYGENDGALILPLSNCDYLDFRPVVQSVQYSATGTRCYSNGPWDEELLWLFGPESLTKPVIPSERSDFKAEAGGYYTLRSSNGFVFTRCANFKHRPGQADMLNVDLWWKGQNIVMDAGTYSYNAPAPWDNSLGRTTFHNTVTVDSLDQMRRAGRFLWLPWLKSKVEANLKSRQGSLAYWQGSHDGYERLDPPVSHRRGILRLGEEHWLVLDSMDCRKEHCYRLHWLFPDLPHEWDEKCGLLTLETPKGVYYAQAAAFSGKESRSLLRADEKTSRGWSSPYYHYREPALSLELTQEARSGLFWTVLGPERCETALDGNNMIIQGRDWKAGLEMGGLDGKVLIRKASWEGRLMDSLEISS